MAEKSHKRFLRILVLLLPAIAGFGLSGCLWLAIPGLAYSGYQYEKTGKLPGMPSTEPQSEDNQRAAPKPTASQGIE